MFPEVVSEQFVLEKISDSKFFKTFCLCQFLPQENRLSARNTLCNFFGQIQLPKNSLTVFHSRLAQKFPRSSKSLKLFFARGRFRGAPSLSRKLFWEKFEVSPKIRLKNSEVGSFEKPPTSIRESLAGARRTSGQGSPRVRTRWKSRQVFESESPLLPARVLDTSLTSNDSQSPRVRILLSPIQISI